MNKTLIVHLNILVCTFKYVIVFYLILNPKDRTKFLFYLPTSCHTLECIIKLTNYVNDFVIYIIHDLLYNDWSLFCFYTLEEIC